MRINSTVCTKKLIFWVWIHVIFMCGHFQNAIIFSVWVQGTSIHLWRPLERECAPQLQLFTCNTICLLITPSGLLGGLNTILVTVEGRKSAGTTTFALVDWWDVSLWTSLPQGEFFELVSMFRQETEEFETCWSITISTNWYLGFSSFVYLHSDKSLRFFFKRKKMILTELVYFLICSYK